MAKSLALTAYLGFARVSSPLWRWSLQKRVKRGKEIAERLNERFGQPALARPDGEVLWFHALSVGESLALLPLFDRILAERPGAHILLTSSTRTSAEALARVGLPDRCIHQFSPVDTYAAVRGFLNHWQPSIAVFAELDFWPVMITQAKAQGLPVLLINSRMSDKNFDKRKRSRGLYTDVLGQFDHCLLQDQGTRDHFRFFGVPDERMQVIGALKGVARPLSADAHTLAELKTRIGTRLVWLAAATERRETEAVLLAHLRVLQSDPGALLILAPRNMGDADGIEAAAKAGFDHVTRRSTGGAPSTDAQVYIADTLGEMGLWYRLAPVSFVGHSQPVEGTPLRGKNPFEAVALGSAVIHGSSVVDFSETYEELDQAGAAVEVNSADDLAQAVLQPAEVHKEFATRATQIVAQKGRILDETWAVIVGYLP